MEKRRSTQRKRRSSDFISPLLSFFRMPKSPVTPPSSCSKSPKVVKENKPILHNVSDSVRNYKKASKLSVSKKKLSEINEKLSLQKISRQEYQIRLKNNELFLKGNSPFLPEKKTEKKTQRKNNKKDKQKKEQIKISMFQGLTQLHQKSQREALISKSKQIKRPKEQQKIYNLIKQKIYRKEGKKYHHKSCYDDVKETQILKNEKDKSVINALDDLDQLLKKKDENWGQQQLLNKRLNIFQFIKNPNSPEFYSLKQKLSHLNFCNESNTGQTTFNQSSLILGISRKARLFIKNKHEQMKNCPEHLSSGDLVINKNILQFQDLMLVSTGRLMPQVLQDYFVQQTYHHKKIRFDQLLNKKEDPVLEPQYKQNQLHRINNHNVSDYSKYQVNLYDYQPLTSQEMKNLNINQSYEKQLSQLLKLKELLKKFNIKSDSVHRTVDERIKKKLQSQQERNKPKQNVNKKIGRNKKSKSRIEQMTSLSLIKNYRMIKQHQQKMKSKSPSPCKDVLRIKMTQH